MQTLDPRMGNQRRKDLLAKVAQKAMSRRQRNIDPGFNGIPGFGEGKSGRNGYRTGGLGMFGRLAQAGRAARNTRPNIGVNNARGRGAGNSLFDGLDGGAGFAPPIPQGLPGAYANTAAVAAAPGFDYTQGPEAAVAPPPALPEAPPAPPPALPEAPPEEDVLYSSLGQQAINKLSQAGPSGPITAPGGLIPLGGGQYYDPATDQIRGGVQGVKGL